MLIKGRHILVTGGAKRIGRHLTLAFLVRGARVSIHYRHSKAEAHELIELAKTSGGAATSVAADLKDIPSIKNAVNLATQELGPVDILVNGASDFYPTPTLDCTEAQWDALQDVNLRGQFFFAQACLPGMLKRGAGVIINIADVHGARPIRNFTPYAVSKAGLLMMTKNLAKEFAPKVRVNSISPGPVLLPTNYSEEQKNRSIEKTLLKRLGSPEDVVQAALFLIGNDYLTGFDLKVDGGRSLL